jgi:integrase
MPRTLRDSKLDTREARARLKVRGKPYWRSLEPGLHLGYRRLASKPGTWCVRRYVGNQGYVVEALKGAVADDFNEADGTTVLSYAQAQRMVLGRKPKAGTTITVATAIERYLTHLSDHGKTADDARYRAEALILPSLGDIEVGALTTEQIRGWQSSLAKSAPRHGEAPGDDAEARRRRKASVNRIFTILRAALNLAYRDGKVPSDTEWRRVKPFGGVDAARVRYLQIDEAQRFINASEPAFRLLVQAALQTGARYGELGRLQVEDFNPDAGTLFIGRSKTGHQRHIVLTDEGQAFFRQLCAGREGSEPMLGKQWEFSAELTKPMRETSKRAKIKPPISFHILRHTWASLAVMKGMPLMVVAKNLGHRDTRMVEKHYGHLDRSYIAEAIRASAPRFGIEIDQTVTPIRR